MIRQSSSTVKFLWVSLFCLGAVSAQPISENTVVSCSQEPDTGLVYLSGDTLVMGSSRVVYDTVYPDDSGVVASNLPQPEPAPKPLPHDLYPTADTFSIRGNGNGGGFFNFVFDVLSTWGRESEPATAQSSADRSDEGSHRKNLFGGSSERPARERGVQH